MKRDNIIKILCVLLIVGIIVLVSKYVTNLNTSKLENHKFYQYFGGRKVEYSGNLEISKKNNGITKLQVENINLELDSTPVYYLDAENKILLPEDMAVIFPNKNGTMQRVTHFSTLQLKNNICYLQYEQKEKQLKNAFLFDGNDLYIFIEPITLKVGEQAYQLSAFSYVIVDYRQTVEIYQKQEDTYQIIEYNQGDVKAISTNYEINLSIDSLKYEGKEQLLLKKIEILNSFQW